MGAMFSSTTAVPCIRKVDRYGQLFGAYLANAGILRSSGNIGALRATLVFGTL